MGNRRYSLGERHIVTDVFPIQYSMTNRGIARLSVKTTNVNGDLSGCRRRDKEIASSVRTALSG